MARSLLGTTVPSFPRIVQRRHQHSPRGAAADRALGAGSDVQSSWSFIGFRGFKAGSRSGRRRVRRTHSPRLDRRADGRDSGRLHHRRHPGRRPHRRRALVPEVSHPYRRIFASYSHKTSPSPSVRDTRTPNGDRYMRDAIDLRSGEIWNDRLLPLIDARMCSSCSGPRTPCARRSSAVSGTRADGEQVAFRPPLYCESPFPERDRLPPPELAVTPFRQRGDR